MDKYGRVILNSLIDKFEASKSFVGNNEVKQNFYLSIPKQFPKYQDDSDFETFSNINDAVKELEQEHFIVVYQASNGTIDRVCLNRQYLDAIYRALGRTGKEKENQWLMTILQEYGNSDVTLGKYARNQLRRICENKKVEFYEGNHKDYEDILKICAIVERNTAEIYVRDISIKVFADSKRLEQLKSKVQSLLFQYGAYEERESVLEECGIVQTPTYVTMKGNGRLIFPKENIDLSKMNGDIAISTKTIDALGEIQIFGRRIVTIENLTTFHDYCHRDDFCIYLGGFHNKIKEQFIKKLYSQNQEKEYYHFGDIDAGGFYIFEHLVGKTEIPFRPMNMDIETLVCNRDAWKTLTKNDSKRLKKLLEKQEERFTLKAVAEDYRDVLKYMLDHNCKLEQEAISISS